MDEFEKEKTYLASVEDFIVRFIDKKQVQNEESKVKIANLKGYLNHMMKIAPDETIKIYEQVSEEFSLVEQRLRQIKRYEQVKKMPYFGKIVIKEFDDVEHLYIGTFDISDLDTNKQYVVDWRAPICALYYHSSLGNTCYEANGEKYDVNLLKKRQFTIKNGELEYYCDTDNKIDDEVLQEILSRNTSAFMTNIIRSIQAEQDEIIRQPIYKNIIVDGVAGSGKTSIGMHRIAYLLYENRDTLTSDNILVLSPNELFSQYVSQLLPELGEDNVKTIPFSLFLSEKFSHLRNAESKSEMMEDILLKNSTRLKIVSEKYTEEYANKLLDFLGNFNVEKCIGTISIRNKKINVPNLKKNYNLSKANRYKIFKRVDFIVEEIMEQVFYNNNFETNTELREEITSTILKKIYKAKLFPTFLSLTGGNIELVNNNIAYDDIATFAFIEMAINGFDVDNTIKQLFIDEVQDYSPIAIKMIREIFPSATLTIVGDYNQNLITTTKNLQSLKEEFPISTYFKLNNSYRSSNNIMRLANSVVNSKNLHNSLSREGTIPKAYKFETMEEFAKIVEDEVKNYDKNQKTAVVCKTKMEAQILSEYLKDFILVNDEKTTSPFFENNKILTTVFLSKGLEFDNVFVYDVTDENFTTEIDRQILYVMITRALHNVVLTYKNKISKLIDVNNVKMI